MLCYVICCNDAAMLCYVMFCHARVFGMPCYVVWFGVLSCSYYVMLCHALLCHVVFCRIRRGREVLLCCDMSSYVMLCHVLLWMFCHVMSCLCYVLSCSIVRCCVLSVLGGYVGRGREAGDPGHSGTLGTTGGLAAAVCRVGVAGRSVLEI